VKGGILPRMLGTFTFKCSCYIDCETSIYILQLNITNFVCFLDFRTILLSVISLLNEPNTFSPANVDASVMYRRWRDSKGKDKEYENIIRYVVHYMNSKIKVMVFSDFKLCKLVF